MIRWIRSKDTPSFKWVCSSRRITIRRTRKKEEKTHRLKLGFHHCRRGLRTGGWRWRASDGLLRQWSWWRRAARREEPDGGDGVADRFPDLHGGAAGAEMALGCSRRCGSAAGKNLGTCQGGVPEDEEKMRRREGARGSLWASELSREARRPAGLRRWIPSDWRGLAQGRKEGRGRRPWAIYSRSWRGRGARVWQDRTEGSGAVREGESSARGGRWHVGSGRQWLKTSASVPFREGRVLGHGLLWRLGWMWPPRPFLIFWFLFIFLFWFSEFFQIFCKNASNEFK
jgi:hypothetical protein